LWAFKARAHAVLGEADDTQRAFAHAHQVLDRSPVSLVAPGIFSFVPEKLAFYEAGAFVALRMPEQATGAADEALRLYDLSETTEPALVRFERASALAQAGELDEACRYAIGTALHPGTYPSITVRSRARAFTVLLGDIADAKTPAVSQWRDIADTVYQPLPPLRAGAVRKELPWTPPNATG